MRVTRRLALLAATAFTGVALVISVPAITAGAAVRPSSPARGYNPVGGRFYGVSASSTTDVWAVGLSNTGSLIQHWNGRTWSTSLDSAGFLEGVSARYWNDVWAVGGTNWFSPSSNLILHWDGSSWSTVPNPSPDGGGYLQDVVATSRGNAWAVGLIAPGGPGVPASTSPFIEHWNGRRWQVQSAAQPDDGGYLGGVAASSRSNVWAVGQTGGSSEGTGQQTLIEHYNGKSWRRIASPNPRGAVNARLGGVSVVSLANAWAVGTSSNGNTSQTLIEHWNGKSWKIVPSPTPDGDDQLNNIATVSARNAWTVGLTNPSECSNGPVECGTLIEHWNGRTWTVVPSPNPPAYYLNALWGVVSFYRNAWAVGSTDYGRTLILHYSGKSWGT